MIDLLRNKDELTKWAVSTFKCDQQKGKENMESRSIKKKGKHRKYSVEVHNEKYSTLYITKIWNLQYEFADARISCFSDSSTRRDLYVFALLRFFIVKTRICIVSALSVL